MVVYAIGLSESLGLDCEVEGIGCLRTISKISYKIGFGILGIGWLTEALGSILGTS